MKIQANIITENESFFGEIDFDFKINSIKKLKETCINESWIYPGFIDLHCHGGGGSDAMEGEQAIRTMLTTHAGHGTTSLLATTVTDTHANLVKVFKEINKVMDNPKESEASLLGVHLEGPFLSPDKLGAQPNFVRSFSLNEIFELHALAPIRVLTIAPESGLNNEDIKQLLDKGMLIQLGHSNATYEQAAPLLQENIKSVTHLFNAMSGMHHRSPGIVGAALAHAHNAELIPDLIHVHPGAIKVALRSIPNLYFVTDATAASGMPDGEYKLGQNIVHKCSNGVRLKDGTLAGSSLTMNQALTNALSLDLSPVESAKRLSTIQANLIKQEDRGVLSIGKRADLVVCDKDHHLSQVFIQGKLI